MARVKRSVHGKKKRREVLAQASGYRGLKKNSVPQGEGADAEVALLRLPRPAHAQA